NLLRYIDNQNIDHRLRLHSHGNIWSSHGIKVAISSSTRAGAKLTGAARLTAKQLSGHSFGIESTGAAKVLLDGTVDGLVTDMTGASTLEAESLQTKTAELSPTGASHAEVAVSESLKASITTTGLRRKGRTFSVSARNRNSPSASARFCYNRPTEICSGIAFRCSTIRPSPK